MNVFNKVMEASDEQGLHTSLHSIGSDTKELKEEWDLDQQCSPEKPGLVVTFESPFHFTGALVILTPLKRSNTCERDATLASVLLPHQGSVLE